MIAAGYLPRKVDIAYRYAPEPGSVEIVERSVTLPVTTTLRSFALAQREYLAGEAMSEGERRRIWDSVEFTAPAELVDWCASPQWRNAYRPQAVREDEVFLAGPSP